MGKVVVFALCLWGAEGMYLHAVFEWVLWSEWMIFPVIPLFLIAGYLTFWSKNKRDYVVVLWGVCFGYALGYLSAFDYINKVNSLSDFTYLQGDVECVSDTSKSTYASSIELRITSDNTRYLVKASYDEDTYGELFKGERFFGKVQLNTNYEIDSYSKKQGIHASGRLIYLDSIETSDVFSALYGFRIRMIKTLLSRIDSSAGNDGACLMLALSCGYRKPIAQSSLMQGFRSSGIAHLVAVSGAHLVVIDACLLILLRVMRINKSLSILLRILILCAYLVCAGLPISGIRASLMTLVGMSAYMAKRRSNSLNSLGVCIAAMLVINPLASVSASFVLSAGSTLGIVLFDSLIRFALNRYLPIGRYIIQSASLTLSAHLATLLYAASTFSYVSLISLPVNVLIAPLFAPLCVLSLICALAGGLFGQSFSDWVFVLGDVSCGAVCEFVRFCARIPFAGIAVSLDVMLAIFISISLVSVVYVSWGRVLDNRTKAAKQIAKAAKKYTKSKSKKVSLGSKIAVGASALVIVFLIFAWPTLASIFTPEIIMLNVGQGDSFVVRSGAKTYMVDTGNRFGELKDAMAKNGIYVIDGVLISHSDADHCACLDELSEVAVVRSVYLARGMFECTCNNCVDLVKRSNELVGSANVIPVDVGYSLSFGKINLEVVWPYTFVDDGANADSMVLRLDCDVDSNGSIDYRALLTGDAERDEIASVIAAGSVGDIDILKVGHHGSRVSLSDENMRVLLPEIALISCGYNNRYGHPKEETLEFLDAYNVAVYRSDLMGNVTVKLSAGGIEVIPEKR
ncbi:MAG: DNA internalization-related competence protein ComEC/Rec2 [Eggerthellaceae bacterium]|nr:DNA internalization-related competence protein ComEC/Rec2 [Eggerthellaceae bacterium]